MERGSETRRSVSVAGRSSRDERNRRNKVAGGGVRGIRRSRDGSWGALAENVRTSYLGSGLERGGAGELEEEEEVDWKKTRSRSGSRSESRRSLKI
eukprot:185042-Hanusia_phi.AAC.1